MQMARPAELKSPEVASRVLTEPLTVKSAQLYHIGKASGGLTRQATFIGRDNADIPCSFFSTLKMLKDERKIEKMEDLNKDNEIVS